LLLIIELLLLFSSSINPESWLNFPFAKLTFPRTRKEEEEEVAGINQKGEEEDGEEEEEEW
jgi:hypothetical protein